jgi:hypothetical protein
MKGTNMRWPARLSAIALIGVSPAVLHAQDFTCANPDAQISCADGSCEIETESFTPMSLSRRGEILEICAYSGCANGPITSRSVNDGVELLHARVAWLRQQEGGSERNWDLLSVIYDGGEKVAQMRWNSFANVMTCSLPD